MLRSRSSRLWSLGILGVLGLCDLCACSPGERALLLSPSAVPKEAVTLRATATLEQQPAREGPQEIPAEQPTLTLGLPRQARGALRVSMEALDAGRCTLASGEASTSLEEGSGPLALAVPLVARPGCPVAPNLRQGFALAGRPRLLSGPGPRAVVSADLNGDAAADLVVAHFGGGTVGVHLSGPGGMPAPTAARYEVGPSPGAVAVADLDGDGHPEIIAALRQNGAIAVLRNNGDGTFATARLSPAGKDPSDLVAADLNSDGRVDLVVADYDGAVGVLLGKGDGTFEPVSRTTADLGTSAVRVAELTGDKLLDVAVVSDRSPNLSILQGDGQGRLSLRTTVSLGAGRLGAQSLAIGDLDQDGSLDVVVGHDLGANSVDRTQVTLVRGAPGAAFMAAQAIVGSGRSVFGLAIADLDGDGRKDVAALSLLDHQLTVLRGLPNGSLQSLTPVYPGHDPVALAIADLDGDGRPDVAVANQVAGHLTLLLGRARDALREPLTAPLWQEGNYPLGLQPGTVADGDVDGDGRVDLVATSSGANTVQVLEGAGDGAFRLGLQLPVSAGARSVALADLTGDRKPELVSAGSTGNLVDVRLNQSAPGAVAFGLLPNLAVNRPFRVLFADLDGDGVPDLLVSVDNMGQSSGQLQVLPGQRSGAFGVPLVINLPAGITDVAAGDMDGDGKPDVVAAGTQGNQVYLLRNSSTGPGKLQLSGALAYPVGLGPSAVALGDVSGDGRLDVVTVNSGGGGDYSVLLGQEGGTLRALAPQRLPGGLSPSFGALADLNGDGRLDLLTLQRGSADLAVSLGQGDGSFRLAQLYGVGAAPIFVGVVDLDGDKRPDVYISNTLAAAGAPLSYSAQPNSLSVLLSLPR